MPEYAKNLPRFYKNQQTLEFGDAVIPIDSTSWNGTRIITVATLGNHIKLMIGTEFLKDIQFEQNVVIQKYTNQANEPSIGPSKDIPFQKTFMATDENWLYVWIESIKKWKRTPLSDWN
jgi:hypothetical protein